MWLLNFPALVSLFTILSPSRSLYCRAINQAFKHCFHCEPRTQICPLYRFVVLKLNRTFVYLKKKE